MEANLFTKLINYAALGFLGLSLIFALMAIIFRENSKRKKVYIQGLVIFLIISALLLLRETKLILLESFARILE